MYSLRVAVIQRKLAKGQHFPFAKVAKGLRPCTWISQIARLISPFRKPKTQNLVMVGYQLDDEPNLYMGNGWTSPCPSTLNWLFGFQVAVLIRGWLNWLKHKFSAIALSHLSWRPEKRPELQAAMARPSADEAATWRIRVDRIQVKHALFWFFVWWFLICSFQGAVVKSFILTWCRPKVECKVIYSFHSLIPTTTQLQWSMGEPQTLSHLPQETSLFRWTGLWCLLIITV